MTELIIVQKHLIKTGFVTVDNNYNEHSLYACIAVELKELRAQSKLSWKDVRDATINYITINKFSFMQLLSLSLEQMDKVLGNFNNASMRPAKLHLIAIACCFNISLDVLHKTCCVTYSPKDYNDTMPLGKLKQASAKLVYIKSGEYYMNIELGKPKAVVRFKKI
jgi:hypothetical protein